MSSQIRKIQENARQRSFMEEQQNEEVKAIVSELAKASEKMKPEVLKRWRAILKEKMKIENEADLDGILEVFSLGYDEGMAYGGLQGFNLGTKKMLEVAKSRIIVPENRIVTGSRLIIQKS